MITTAQNEHRPSTPEQDASDARFYAALDAQEEGDGDEADLYDPRDRF